MTTLSPACQDVLNTLGLEVGPLAEMTLELTGTPLNQNDPVQMLTQVTSLLLAERAVREQSLNHLIVRYDALRNDLAAAQAKLHQAQTPVARAATQYRDVKLAQLARDVLTGTPRREALDRLPTGTQELRRFLEQ